MKHTNLLTQADRDMFDRIDKDCIAMHVCPPPKTFIELNVKDADGVEVERYTDRAHSWVRNTYNALFNFASYIGMGTLPGFGQGKTGIKGVSGTVFGGSYTGCVDNVSYGGSGTTTAGIVVGSSVAMESFEGYALGTKILNGITAGLISYALQATPSATYDIGAKKMTTVMTRVFNNNSGGSLTISEVGVEAASSNGPFLMCRDLLASPVTVPNAGQLTVTYTIEMTFPA